MTRYDCSTAAQHAALPAAMAATPAPSVPQMSGLAALGAYVGSTNRHPAAALVQQAATPARIPELMD